MTLDNGIDFVFFDIGGTLGDYDPVSRTFTPYPDSAGLLTRLTRPPVGLRVGVITNLGTDLTNEDAIGFLRQAGLADFIDPEGFVSDRDAGSPKPDPAIYRFAARRVGMNPDRCLYVGENLAEVIAAQAAGMKGVLKPPQP